MASRGAYKRLTKEYKSFEESPPPFIQAVPNESNILEWHYVITGPPETPYEGGQYHGTLTFPADYPFKPPAIRMFTPSGRFRPGMRLCLSISDYHPKTWNPAWSVSTILTGLLSFMVSEESTAGSIGCTDASRKRFASQSKYYNAELNSMFVQHFPDLVAANRKELAEAVVDAAAVARTAISAPVTVTFTVPTSAPAPAAVGVDVPVSPPQAPAGQAVEQLKQAEGARFSQSQKFICFAFLFISWLVASKLFASHL